MLTINWWILLCCLAILFFIVGSVFLIHPSCCGNKKEKRKQEKMEIVDEIKNGMKTKRGKTAFARDYGAQLSLSNEVRSKKTSAAIMENINRLYSMKKTNLVRKVIQLERQLNVYSANGFVSVKDVKELAERKGDEENQKLKEKLDCLEEHNQFLKSRIATIEKLLKENDKKEALSKPEEGSDKSSSSSLSTVINLSSPSLSCDHTESLNRSIPEMAVRNSTLDCSDPLHDSSDIEVKIEGTQEEEKMSSFKKSLQKFSNIFGRQNSKNKNLKVEIDKPICCIKPTSGDDKKEDITNPFIEDEKVELNTNPFYEGEKDSRNTNPFDEDEKEELSTNPFFEHENVGDNITSIRKVDVDENENEVTTSVHDLNVNILETDQFWAEVETHDAGLKKMEFRPHKKLKRDIVEEKKESTKDKTSWKDNNENEINLPTNPEFLKNLLCQSLSLDNSGNEEGENFENETSSIKSEPVTVIRKKLLCHTVSLDGGVIRPEQMRRVIPPRLISSQNKQIGMKDLEARRQKYLLATAAFE